jgi:hypothetical protein
MALFGPCLAFGASFRPLPGLASHCVAIALTSGDVVLSAMVNRYTPYVTFPYYIALASQLLASLYAYTSIRETLRSKKSESDAGGSESGEEEEGIIERAVERVTVPVRPLRVLMPWRDERGVLHWELAALAVSLFATTCGVRSFRGSGWRM